MLLSLVLGVLICAKGIAGLIWETCCLNLTSSANCVLKLYLASLEGNWLQALLGSRNYHWASFSLQKFLEQVLGQVNPATLKWWGESLFIKLWWHLHSTEKCTWLHAPIHRSNVKFLNTFCLSHPSWDCVSLTVRINLLSRSWYMYIQLSSSEHGHTQQARRPTVFRIFNWLYWWCDSLVYITYLLFFSFCINFILIWVNNILVAASKNVFFQPTVLRDKISLFKQLLLS